MALVLIELQNLVLWLPKACWLNCLINLNKWKKMAQLNSLITLKVLWTITQVLIKTWIIRSAVAFVYISKFKKNYLPPSVTSIYKKCCCCRYHISSIYYYLCILFTSQNVIGHFFSDVISGIVVEIHLWIFFSNGTLFTNWLL